MVAQVCFGAGVVLFRQQARGPEQSHQLVEQLQRIVQAAYSQISLDQPGGADVEATLQTRQTVVVPVSEDRGPHPQLPLDGCDGVQETLVLDIKEARQADVQ